jgi:acyl-CoA synthetase (AMP-forming)/AMP-acid ligase II
MLVAIRASIWSWIFEDEPYATPGPRICGYTDAITGQRLPFQQLKLYSERVSTVLHASFDVRPGDKISIFSHNSIWYPVALFAALRLGAIVSPGPAECTVTELESMLAIVRPKVVILGSSYAPSTEAIRAMLPHSRGVLMMQARDPVATGLESIEGFSRADNSDQGSVAPWRIGVEESNEALCALLCFSSGTTGLPKAVRSHPILPIRPAPHVTC